MTKKHENLILVISSLVFLFYTLIGSYITTGSTIDLLIILTLVSCLIQYIFIKIKEKNK